MRNVFSGSLRPSLCVSQRGAKKRIFLEAYKASALTMLVPLLVVACGGYGTREVEIKSSSNIELATGTWISDTSCNDPVGSAPAVWEVLKAPNGNYSLRNNTIDTMKSAEVDGDSLKIFSTGFLRPDEAWQGQILNSHQIKGVITSERNAIFCKWTLTSKDYVIKQEASGTGSGINFAPPNDTDSNAAIVGLVGSLAVGAVGSKLAAQQQNAAVLQQQQAAASAARQAQIAQQNAEFQQRRLAAEEQQVALNHQQIVQQQAQLQAQQNAQLQERQQAAEQAQVNALQRQQQQATQQAASQRMAPQQQVATALPPPVFSHWDKYEQSGTGAITYTVYVQNNGTTQISCSLANINATATDADGSSGIVGGGGAPASLIGRGSISAVGYLSTQSPSLTNGSYSGLNCVSVAPTVYSNSNGVN